MAVERIADATTAARVRVGQGAPAPGAGEVARVEGELRELAGTLRPGHALVGVRAGPAAGEGNDQVRDEDGVLAPLRQEVGAARAIVSPHPDEP